MKKLLTLAALALAGCVTIDTGESDDFDREDGREISSVAVPEKVLAAARTRIPGFALQDAELLQRNGATVYALEGNARGEDYEIDVTPGGHVLRVDR
jgi:uncharacterized membrane protein YkoI